MKKLIGFAALPLCTPASADAWTFTCFDDTNLSWQVEGREGRRVQSGFLVGRV